MTSIGKIMAVFTAAASLVFLGFVWVSSVGGPNWRAEALELDEHYVLETGEGENSNYTIRTVHSGEQFDSSSPNLAKLVVDARRHRSEQQTQQIRALDEELATLNTELTNAEQFIQADLAALTKRENELASELEALNSELREITQQAIEKSQEAYDTRAESERLRNDVVRLKTQLNEIRIDRHRGEVQRAKLEDLLIRYEAQAEALKRRNRQLKAATTPYENGTKVGVVE